MSDKRRRIDWGNHLFNFLATLLGVLIAFYLANYQEHRREEVRLAAAMENIKAEISSNKRILEQHLDANSKQMRALSAIAPLLNDENDITATEPQMTAIQEQFPGFYEVEERTYLRDSLYEWNGSLSINFNYLEVSDLAWRNAQNLNILHLVDFEVSSQLNELYFFQQEVLNEVQKAIDIVKGLSNANEEEIVMRRRPFFWHLLPKPVRFLGAILMKNSRKKYRIS